MIVSVVIRTLNEERYLEDLLSSIQKQQKSNFEVEVIIVDSGSTDSTLKIAEKYQSQIVHIKKEDFSFGRSLNMGCEAAKGEYLVFVSGHCVPTDGGWLKNLISPLASGAAAYSYGRQVGGAESKFSECLLFEKFFPKTSAIPQEGFFANNANAALIKRVWEQNPFDEELTGLEDMHLAKKLLHQGHKIAYVAEAAVYHYHHETWRSVRRRYEREAIALQYIMPEIHLTLTDVFRYYMSAVFLDFGAALQERVFWKKIGEILTFRFMQFWGSYCGNNEHRRLSKKQKEAYFYPRNA